MKHPNLQELATRIHAQNKAAGWWDIPRPRVQTAWLVVTELAEATEAERAGRYADLELFDTAIKSGSPFALEFKTHIKDTFEDEIADAVIRLLDFAASEGMSFIGPYTQGRRVGNEDAFFFVSDYLYTINRVLTDRAKGEANTELHSALSVLCRLAKQRNFDLWKHVELKLKYNATRPKMHGKKF